MFRGFSWGLLQRLEIQFQEKMRGWLPMTWQKLAFTSH
jgi:hypothetical protein